MLIVLGPQISR